MRDIKFRAWDINNKKYHYDVQNTYDENIGDSFQDILDNENLIVEQDTGLKDCNNVSICEGDIVKLYSETHDIFGFEITKQQTGRIYFVDGAFFISGGTGDDPIYAYEGELEVIGNIHEQPELLEEK
ncbi:YopX family protein [Leuconostoc citreum]